MRCAAPPFPRLSAPPRRSAVGPSLLTDKQKGCDAVKPGHENSVRLSGSSSDSPKIYVNTAAIRWAETQNQFPDGITQTALRFLATKADQFGCSYYTLSSMANEVGFCERTLRDRLKTLSRAGLVRTIRRARNGQRAGNVYQLMAWPRRKLIPAEGHSKLGRYVVEDVISLSSWGLNRHQISSNPASGAALNQTHEKNLLPCNEERRAILDLCLDELGRWATQKNRAGLIAAHGTLFELLDAGYDLHRHVLPVLRSKAESSQRIPRLNNYFREAIATHAAISEGQKKDPEPAPARLSPADEQRRRHDRSAVVRGIMKGFSNGGPLGAPGKKDR